ncbi:hypothetical protein BS78_01G099900 [Paspalum vaginatum]|nr:hypothetical protein BS78_01G099900 [Paspalum vaginatum]
MLASTPSFTRSWRQARTRTVSPFLVPQMFNKPPPTWILISLTGSAAQEKVTLAMRNDNIYIAGFSNSVGTWYAFPRFQGLIKGSTTLPRTEDYGSLVGGHSKLPNYDVNKEAIIQAVRFLSAYKPTSDASQLGLNLARLIVVVAEAARFRPIYNTVLQQQPRITVTEARMVVIWAKLSDAIITYSKTQKWVNDGSTLDEFSKAGINGPQEAIDALKILILPKGVKPPAVVS